VRWDDPAFRIAWPPTEDGERIINARDREYTDFTL
jgi:dTDP-4-dehydrorhamnose 3,5-epimerase-like enzyme